MLDKLNKKQKDDYINKFLKGTNNPFYKNTKKYVITFPDGKEYIIKIMEFCKNYKEIKLHSAGLYNASRNMKTYKKFRCRIYNPEIDKNINKWNN